MTSIKYNKDINNYASQFVQNFYENLDATEYVSTLNLKDRNNINDVLIRYYSYFFMLIHSKDKKLMHSPELATDFNSIFISLAIQAVRLYYFSNPEPKLEDTQKKLLLDSLIKAVGFKLVNLKQDDLTNAEIVSSLFDFMYDQHKKMLENKYNFDDFSYMPQNTKLRMFVLPKILYENFIQSKLNDLKQKLYRIINFEDNESFKVLSSSIIPFCLLFFFLPLCGLAFNNIKFIILVSIFYIGFFALFGYLLTTCLKIKNKIDAIKLYQNYYDHYQRLGVDIVSIYVSENLISYAEDEMLYAISNLRLYLTDKKGFVTPYTRILDHEKLEDNTMIINVRGRKVCELKFYPDKFAMDEENIKAFNIKQPKDTQKTEFEGDCYYWVDKKYVKNIDEDFYFTPYGFIKIVLHQITFKYLDKIFTEEEAFALLELIASQYKNKDMSSNIYELTDYSILDFKDIFVKILQKGGSIKDILYVFERIVHYSKSNKDLDTIAFAICQDLTF